MSDYSLYKDFEGWLTDYEADELYVQAKKARSCIVEIGCWQGKSTACLLFGSFDGYKVPVHTIDTFLGSYEHQPLNTDVFKAFNHNIDLLGADVNGNIEVHIGLSIEMVSEIPNNIDLLFIDGSHDWFSVMRDFVLYYPKVSENGVIVFHDSTTWDGVIFFTQFLDCLFHSVKRVDSLFIINKKNEVDEHAL